MDTLIAIIVFALVLSTVILIHEGGHFFFAKRAGILCHEFSLGMGPKLFSKKINETTYLIKAIPVGGYVMMAGEEIDYNVVKPKDTVRLVLEGNVVKKIVLDENDKRYIDSSVLVHVEQVDLLGKGSSQMYINDYVVDRCAFIVYTNREMQIAPFERRFESKTKRQRFWTIFGGPMMNLILAFFIFLLISLVSGVPVTDNTKIGSVGDSFSINDSDETFYYPAKGHIKEGDIVLEVEGTSVSTWNDISKQLDKLATNTSILFTVLRDGEEMDISVSPIIAFYSIGIYSDVNSQDIVIGLLEKQFPGYKAGLREGDKIVSVDGVEITTWKDLYDVVSPNSDGKEMVFVVNRDGGLVSVTVAPFTDNFLDSQGVSVVDNVVGISTTSEFSFFGSIKMAFLNVGSASVMIIDTIGLLFGDPQVSVSDLSGPIGIFSITKSFLAAGIMMFLSWVALLSVNLGVVNLLPIPALDGGRLVFLGYEAIFRKPINKKIENTLHLIMFAVLMVLFVYVSVFDIWRLMS